MKYTKAFLTGKSSANIYRNLKEVIIMSSFEKNLSEGNVAKQLVCFHCLFWHPTLYSLFTAWRIC